MSRVKPTSVQLADLIASQADALLATRRESPDTLIDDSGAFATSDNPVIHGLDRLNLGFDLEEVVSEYNALRNAVLELAGSHQIQLTGSLIHSVNRVIDGAIGIAVKAFSAQQALEIRARRNEYLAFTVHDLSAPLASLSLATTLLERQIGAPTGADKIELIRRKR